MSSMKGQSSQSCPITLQRRSRTSVGKSSGRRSVGMNSGRIPRSGGGGTAKTKSTSSGSPPDADRVLLAECKWTNEPVGHALVSQFREKAERVCWGPDTRNEDFASFSRSGFVDGLADDMYDDWSLFELSEMAAFL